MNMAEDTNKTIDTNADSNELTRIDNAQEMMTPVLAGDAVPEASPASIIEEPATVIQPPPAPSPRKTPSKPEAPAPSHDDETEYERTQRLKLNTDEAPHSGAINDDIAKILKDSKLPERRDFKAIADVKHPAAPPPPPPPNVQAAFARATATPAVAPVGSDTPKKRDIVTALHTLKDDMQDIVLVRKMSLVRASALEQDKKRGQPEIINSDQTPANRQRARRTVTTVFFAALFIALGLGSLYGVSLVTQSSTTPATRQYPSVIFAEQSKILPLDGSRPSDLKALLLNARGSTGSPIGSITRIIPTLATTTLSGTEPIPANLEQFFTALGIKPPDQLMRGLGSDFFFGIHTVDVNGPILIIPVTSYDLAFSGMLAWEPSMNSSLTPVYDAVPSLITGPDGLPKQRTFSDSVILNYDVRELKDDTGAVVLYYSFPTPNLLIIAESVHSFPEVLSRLQAQRQL